MEHWWETDSQGSDLTEELSSAGEGEDSLMKEAMNLGPTHRTGNENTSRGLLYSEMPGRLPEAHCFQMPSFFQYNFIEDN